MVASHDTLPGWPEVTHPSASDSVVWQRVTGNLDQACWHVQSQPTDLMIVEVTAPTAAQWQQLAHTLSGQPRLRVVLLSRDESAPFMRHALRAGVRDVLSMPISTEALDRVCQEQLQQARSPSIPAAQRSRVMAFVSAKGGSGATFLATSVAHAISLRGAEVAVLDLNGGAGDAAWYLSDSAPTAGLLELSGQLHRLDASLLEASLISCSPHLRVLPGSGDHISDERPTAQAVSRVLSLMRERFDTTAVDLPVTWDESTQEAAHQANAVYLVVNNHVADVRAAKRWLERAHTLPDLRSKLCLVVNHVHAYSPIGADAVREALEFEQAREIPHSPRAAAHATNHGLPLLAYSRSDPVAKALSKWSLEWMGGPPKRSWWSWARRGRSQWLTTQPA